MNEKRMAIIEQLKKASEEASKIVNDGDWSQEAIDISTARRAAYVHYETWAKKAPEGATHPTESYF